MLNYYPPMQAPFMAQPQFVAPTPQETEDIKYVNGKQGAEAYQMYANRKAILMDANMSRFYMKQTDANGQATIRAYDFKEAESEKPVEYVTKEEFEQFKSRFKGEVRHEQSAENNNRK